MYQHALPLPAVKPRPSRKAVPLWVIVLAAACAWLGAAASAHAQAPAGCSINAPVVNFGLYPTDTPFTINTNFSGALTCSVPGYMSPNIITSFTYSAGASCPGGADATGVGSMGPNSVVLPLQAPAASPFCFAALFNSLTINSNLMPTAQSNSAANLSPTSIPMPNGTFPIVINGSAGTTMTSGGAPAGTYTGILTISGYYGPTAGVKSNPFSFQVPISITFVPACTLAVTPMNFGNITDLTTLWYAQATVTVNCGTGLNWTLTGDDGQNATTGSGATRQMKVDSPGTATMPYTIYLDSSHSNQFAGSTVTGTTPPSGVGTNSDQTIPLYGQAFPTSLTPGTYKDTVVLTITY